MVVSGYAGKILKVDLSGSRFEYLPTAEYTGKFLGGRGLAARLYWDLVPPDTEASDPANCLICATGPVTGFFGLAGCRWTICGKTAAAQPEAFSHGNLGGKWGSALKYAGYDALVVQGKAEKPVYLYIHDGTVEIRDASHIWGRSTFDAEEILRSAAGEGVSLICIGPAAENQVAFSTALADRGASVSSGLGGIFGSKKLKAILVAGNQRPQASDHDALRSIVNYIRPIRAGTFNAPSSWVIEGVTRNEPCYGCGLGCSRQAYTGEKGRRYKSFCQASVFYLGPALKYYQERNDVVSQSTRLCDAFGLDTVVMQPMISWLKECYREGIINEKETGLPLSMIGSLEFIETLVRKIAFREGFGDVLAQGSWKAAGSLGEKALRIAEKYLATRIGECVDYDPRLIPHTALLYATELRRPIQQLHAVAGNLMISWSSWAQKEPGAFFTSDDLREVAVRFWKSAQAADFSNWTGKALASKTVQDRAYAQESLVLCDVHWPMMITSAGHPEGHVGDPTLESRILSAITGRETDAAELLNIGERIFNLQRAILLRQGWQGRRDDRLPDYFHNEPLKKGESFVNRDAVMPGPNGQPVSRAGAVVDRREFEDLKSEYYYLRGWDVVTGYPSKSKLEELDLADVAADLDARGLLR